MTAPTDNLPQIPVCPECGAPLHDRPSLRAALANRAVRWLPRLGVLGVLLLFILGAVFSQNRYGGGPWASTHWIPAAGPLTVADLPAIADGTRDAAPLLSGLTKLLDGPWVTNEQPVRVRFVPPEGTIYDSTVYGWPTTLATHWLQSQYKDVFAKTGPAPRDWGLTTQQFWNRAWNTMAGAKPAAIDERWAVSPPEVALHITYILAAWYVGKGAAALWLRIRKDARDRRVACGAIAAAIVAAAITIGTLATPLNSVYIILSPTFTSWASPPASSAPTFPTGWTTGELKDILAADDAAPAIARQILSLVPPDTDRSLSFDFGITNTIGPLKNIAAGYPSSWFLWDEGTHSQPMIAQFGPGLRINASHMGEVSYTQWRGTSISMVAVLLPELSVYILMAFLAWHALRAIAALLTWCIQYRRHAKGLCLRCAYNLAGLQPVAPT